MTTYYVTFALQQIDARRYWDARIPLPKPPPIFNFLFEEAREDEFKRQVRVSRWAFKAICEMVKDHPVFARGERGPPQAPVRTQLMVTLYRFGADGNAAAVDRIASHFAIGGVLMCTRCSSV